LTVSGVAATRVSPARVSAGIPMRMEFPCVRGGRLSTVAGGLRDDCRVVYPAGGGSAGLEFTRNPTQAPPDVRTIPCVPTMPPSGDTPFRPSVTVAAVIERDHRFLLVEEHTEDGLRLNQPAGHLDPGESLVEAAARETLEETAHLFVPRALVGVYLLRAPRRGGPARTFLRFAFTGDVGALQDRALDEGIVRALWMSVDELRDSRERHRSPLVLRCVEDYLAGQRFELSLLHTDPSALGSDGPPESPA
jgi:8-oxo-dGTP pyrophosphatase MutT (NUDIX family)